MTTRFEGAAGGSAPVVGENGAALGQHGLLEVVLGHGPAGVELLKIGTDALGRRLVKDQLFAEGGGQYVLGQIVTGGAQAAGGDEDVGPPLGNLHRGAQPLRVVAHHRVVEDVDADAAESLGDHLGVGVGDVAEEQLGAHGDEFGCVGHDKSLRMPTPGSGECRRPMCSASKAFPQDGFIPPEDVESKGALHDRGSRGELAPRPAAPTRSLPARWRPGPPAPGPPRPGRPRRPRSRPGGAGCGGGGA